MRGTAEPRKAGSYIFFSPFVDLSHAHRAHRNALPDWHKYGYITLDYSRSISKGIEYAQNDFAAYVVAKGLGKKKDAKKYFGRAQNWNNCVFASFFSIFMCC